MAKRISFLKYAYRLFYNLISIILICAIIWVHINAPNGAILEHHWILTALSIALLSLGLLISVVAFRSYNLWEFLGLVPEGDSGGGLVTSGLNAFVRHPLYLGAIIGLFGLLCYFPKWDVLLSVVLASVYFIIGIRFEEVKLRRTFASVYEMYMSQTPCLIPKRPIDFIKRLIQ